MSTYTIVEVRDMARRWQTQKGAEMRSYRVKLRNSDGRELDNVEVARVASAPIPKPGESLDGTVDTSGQYGPKFREPRPQGGGGGFRGKTVEERRSIAMQSSIARGVEVVRLEIDYGVKCDDIPKAVADYATRFYAMVLSAEAGS